MVDSIDKQNVVPNDRNEQIDLSRLNAVTSSCSLDGQEYLAKKIVRFILGDGLKARVLRGSFWTLGGQSGGMIIRLGSNLILTRLLFPEAFGLMALVSIFIQALEMFSDTGIGAAIVQSNRGDDKDFLDTAWTIGIIRGISLWIVACVLVWPIAWFFEEPMLVQLIPVSGLLTIIAGLSPTKSLTVSRHLNLGAYTRISLASQSLSVATMILLAWFFPSVWSLVIGTLAGGVFRLVLLNKFLPGDLNRFHWDRAATSELFHFGRWIFVSTMFVFIIQQGDRVILGKFLNASELGIYNIGYFLATVPTVLSFSLDAAILFPLYKRLPLIDNLQNQHKIFRSRMSLSCVLMGLSVVLMFAGPLLVRGLYDTRYTSAGGVVTLLALSLLPKGIIFGSAQVLLAVGDSKRFLLFSASYAIVQSALIIMGIQLFGVGGLAAGTLLTSFLLYPLLILLTRPLGAWMPLHDFGMFVLTFAFGLGACWINYQDILVCFLKIPLKVD
jgi:O-antigen/teichoic acid export membrane protein